jgi:hypothetical protein
VRSPAVLGGLRPAVLVAEEAPKAVPGFWLAEHIDVR